MKDWRENTFCLWTSCTCPLQFVDIYLYIYTLPGPCVFVDVTDLFFLIHHAWIQCNWVHFLVRCWIKTIDYFVYWCIALWLWLQLCHMDFTTKWRKLVAKSSVVPQRLSWLRDRWWWYFLLCPDVPGGNWSWNCLWCTNNFWLRDRWWWWDIFCFALMHHEQCKHQPHHGMFACDLNWVGADLFWMVFSDPTPMIK